MQEMAALSLLSVRPGEVLREKLGLPREGVLDAFIRLVAKEAGVDEERAKGIIKESPALLAMMFILA